MLDQPLELPCGAVLANRIVKAATSDGLGDGEGHATPAQANLYRCWSQGGAGLVLIGEVQVDHRFPERPGNIALDVAGGEEALRALTAAGTSNGNHFWAQLGHAGALTYAGVNDRPLAPSELTVGGNRTRGMSGAEIAATIRRFAEAAQRARAVGFTGVEIHGAHGFLISQFLSPRFNTREDAWGGSLANRARFLLEVVRAVRAAVGPDFPVGVKLNSADFQKGGFTLDESRRVVEWLDGEAIDLLEISGGTYESDDSAASERPRSETALAREAYFLDYAEAIRASFSKPILVTGGFRSLAAIARALAQGSIDLAGMARALVVEPDLARRFLRGESERAIDAEQGFPHPMPTGGGTAWYGVQLMRLGDGLAPDLDLRVADAVSRYNALDRSKACAGRVRRGDDSRRTGQSG